MIVLAVGGLTIGNSLHGCSIAILRLWVALMIWVRLPIGLTLVGRHIGVVWGCIMSLTGLGCDGGLPGGWFSRRSHI